MELNLRMMDSIAKMGWIVDVVGSGKDSGNRER